MASGFPSPPAQSIHPLPELPPPPPSPSPSMPLQPPGMTPAGMTAEYKGRLRLNSLQLPWTLLPVPGWTHDVALLAVMLLPSLRVEPQHPGHSSLGSTVQGASLPRLPGGRPAFATIGPWKPPFAAVIMDPRVRFRKRVP
ncbi:hypothetical protein Vafri_19473 [Volvox africanus]|uniref:Uncharacterized protein n=1 Tax=Volvox africanus TaxID=51714 RepID=A0A8J4BPE5_9CHLO|nr:hypothetical protein Vafri_19473 [Volvox africanus]